MEKLEKLKKSLDNKFIPDNMKDKIRAEIKKLESEIKTDETMTATEVKEEVKEIEEKVEKALEVAEKKEEIAEAKKEEAQEKAEAKAEEKKAKKSRTKTPKADEKPKSAKKSVFSIAKEIRKDGESWEDAKERARKMMKSETTETKKKTKTETQKLLAMVRRNKEYKKLAGTSDLPKDASRRALPRGKRVSADGNVYYENRANRVDIGGFKNAYLENGGYANKGVYVETLDEEIDLTDDGKPRVLKTQEGGNKSFSQRREMHGASPEALAFDNGGKVGRYSILGEVDGEQPVLYATTDDKERIKPLVNMAEIDLHELTGKNHRIFVTDEVTDDEVYHYGNGGRTRERRYVNYSQDYEVRYSKDKPHRRGYGYAGGGVVLDNVKIEVYKSFHGLKAENYFDDVNGYDWNVVTMKRHTGELVSSARGGKANKSEGNVEFFTFDYNSPNIKLISSRPSRVTEKVIEIQHSQALQLFKEKMEEGNFADGGTIIGTPETPLARGLDIDYTGLVGETGGMSAGEMFAEGGSIGQMVNFEDWQLYDRDTDLERMKKSCNAIRKNGFKAIVVEDKGMYYVLYKSMSDSKGKRVYAEGGSLGNHGLKQGDQIIKTMSGGVQKVKTKSGDIVYVNLANGYRGAEPPLPFSKGGALTNERRHVNKSQDYEVRYAKNKPNRTGYLGKRSFDEGGISNGRYEVVKVIGFDKNGKTLPKNEIKVIADFDSRKEALNFVYEQQFKKDVTQRDIFIRDTKTNKTFAEGGFMTDPNFGDFQNQVYSTGGVTKNYIGRNQLNTITIKKGDKKLTYKVSDVYNGAYKLEEGGNLEKTAFYVSKRNVVKVQLKNGKDVKVANGYWIKKGAKPIHTSKYDDGGEMEYAGGGNLNYGIPKEDLENYKIEEVLKDIVDIDYDNSNLEKSKYIILAKPINNNYKNNWYEPKVFIITEKGIYTISNVKKSKWEEIKKDIFDNELTFEKYGYFKIMLNGGKTTFKEKATAIAKKFEGKKVEPKYQKEYGKTYDKAEAKEVGNKIAGSQKAKYDAKMSGGGSTKRGGAMQLAKEIRKDGESWQSALKRANEQMRNK